MRKLILALIATAWTTSARAGIGDVWDFLKQYEFGIDYTNSYDAVDATYVTDKKNPDPDKDCVNAPAYGNKQRCTVAMAGGGSSGYGFFLQRAFKRSGNWYFEPDLGFGVRYLSGKASDQALKQEQDEGHPLKEMSFRLAAVIVKPMLIVGITPASSWPDILVSFGPAAQIAFGNVSVDGKTEAVGVATSSESLKAFFQLEIVVWRFGKGALSFFHANDVSGDGTGSRFYPKAVDGMDDIRANFDRSVGGGVFGLGVKLLFNWP